MPTNQFRGIRNSHRIKRVFRLPEEDPNLTRMTAILTLQYAIRYDLKVDMFYEDDHAGGKVLRGYRNVSPVALGEHITSGNIVFRGYLNEGVSKSERIPKWRLWRVDRVKSIVLVTRNKAKFNKLYRPNDKHIGSFIEQSSFE